MVIESAKRCLEYIQRILNYDRYSSFPQFSSNTGLGRAALSSCILSILLGIHFTISIHYTMCYVPFYKASCPAMTTLAVWQWCTYVCSLCIFHLLEFFVTALYNPCVATSDSFLINHSVMYTAAALTSWIEFWTKQLLFWIFKYEAPVRFLSFFKAMSISGLVLVIVAQWLRSCAMVTASESFNHYIQIRKNENHRLVKRGVYAYIRHPSYMGFFFWSIGTQLVLGNVIHTIVYAAASWSFFYRRIAYEEESLCKFFPDEYPSYVSTTVSGIPFIYTKIQYNNNEIQKFSDPKHIKKAK